MDTFGHLDPEDVNLWERRLEDDQSLFYDDETSLPELAQIINEYNTDLDHNYDLGEGYNVYSKTGREALQTFYEISLRTTRNFALMKAAWEFFQFPVFFCSDFLHALQFQPVEQLQWMIRHGQLQFFSNQYGISHLGMAYTDEEIKSRLLAKADKNPDQRVKPYLEWHFRSCSDLAWDQAVHHSQLVNELAQESTSYFSWLVRDIRQFVLAPYLDRFYLFPN